MGSSRVSDALVRHLGEIERRAVERSGVPESLAREASRKVLSNVTDVGENLGAIERRRIHGYFWAVVRRRALVSRSTEFAELRERFITRTLEADATLADSRRRVDSYDTGRRPHTAQGSAAAVEMLAFPI